MTQPPRFDRLGGQRLKIGLRVYLAEVLPTLEGQYYGRALDANYKLVVPRTEFHNRIDHAWAELVAILEGLKGKDPERGES
jgi:hypothetical protein